MQPLNETCAACANFNRERQYCESKRLHLREWFEACERFTLSQRTLASLMSVARVGRLLRITAEAVRQLDRRGRLRPVARISRCEAEECVRVDLYELIRSGLVRPGWCAAGRVCSTAHVVRFSAPFGVTWARTSSSISTARIHMTGEKRGRRSPAALSRSRSVGRDGSSSARWRARSSKSYSCHQGRKHSHRAARTTSPIGARGSLTPSVVTSA
jgi:hypothetical protein